MEPNTPAARYYRGMVATPEELQEKQDQSRFS